MKISTLPTGTEVVQLSVLVSMNFSVLGLTVYHPMEQFGDEPHWTSDAVDKNSPYYDPEVTWDEWDVGVVVKVFYVEHKDVRTGGSWSEFRARFDTGDGTLQYSLTNLWTKVPTALEDTPVERLSRAIKGTA